MDGVYPDLEEMLDGRGQADGASVGHGAEFKATGTGCPGYLVCLKVEDLGSTPPAHQAGLDAVVQRATDEHHGGAEGPAEPFVTGCHQYVHVVP